MQEAAIVFEAKESTCIQLWSLDHARGSKLDCFVLHSNLIQIIQRDVFCNTGWSMFGAAWTLNSTQLTCGFCATKNGKKNKKKHHSSKQIKSTKQINDNQLCLNWSLLCSATGSAVSLNQWSFRRHLPEPFVARPLLRPERNKSRNAQQRNTPLDFAHLLRTSLPRAK